MKIRAVVKPRIERKDKCCNDSDYSTESEISQRLESSQRKYDNIRGNLEMGIIFFLWGKKKKSGVLYSFSAFSAEKNNFRRHKERPKWRIGEGCGAF